MKVFSSFLLPIPFDGKKRGNKDALGKKAFSEAAFLIFPLYNSFKDTLLLFLFHPLIISPSFRLFLAKLGVGVSGKGNVGKSRGDDPGSISADADGGTRVDNLGTKTDIDQKQTIQR